MITPTTRIYKNLKEIFKRIQEAVLNSPEFQDAVNKVPTSPVSFLKASVWAAVPTTIFDNDNGIDKNSEGYKEFQYSNLKLDKRIPTPAYNSCSKVPFNGAKSNGYIHTWILYINDNLVNEIPSIKPFYENLKKSLREYYGF